MGIGSVRIRQCESAPSKQQLHLEVLKSEYSPINVIINLHLEPTIRKIRTIRANFQLMIEHRIRLDLRASFFASSAKFHHFHQPNAYFSLRGFRIRVRPDLQS